MQHEIESLWGKARSCDDNGDVANRLQSLVVAGFDHLDSDRMNRMQVELMEVDLRLVLVRVGRYFHTLRPREPTRE
jgi:hypothetical protein